MTPTPPPVEKLLAFLAGFTRAERLEIGGWLAARERAASLVRAALRAECLADGPLPAPDRTPPPRPKASPDAPLRLARAAAGCDSPFRISDVAGRVNRSESWVSTVLAHPYFALVRRKAGPNPGLYELTAAGRAAVADAGAARATG